MSRKTAVNLNDNRIDKRFATWIKMVIDLIAPKFLWLVAGRATSKTSDIIAERFIDICYDMPGAYFAFVSDTYVNALKNVVPALIEGLNRKGWIEGIHYVVDEPPPAHFAKPYKAPQEYKHTISVFNGCFVNLVSMDQPSGAAGNSYQHLFGDETKYLDFNKIKKLTPALRGYKKFAKSVYYRGSTFTTDMPNITDGEFDWILDREKDMDQEQCQLALQSGLVLNEIKIELMNETKAFEALYAEKVSEKTSAKVKPGDKSKQAEHRKKIVNLQKQMQRWEARWRKVRKNSSFFKIVSSYVNVDFLTQEYFEDSLVALGPEEFKTAIGSFPAKLKKGERFYINFGPQHISHDMVNTDYYKKFGIGEDVQASSNALRYLVPTKPIDIGVDFGGTCWLISGQESGNMVNLFKNFWTLPPEHLKELAKQFAEYYKDHPCKVVNMWYDRSANQYKEIKKDFASELIGYLEAEGWSVISHNDGQGTIYQEEEFTLMKNIFAGDNPDLPQVRICAFGCREYISSLNISKTIVKISKEGNKTIHKDKTSEKMPRAKLAMFSTNFSDAGKYFFFRPDWVKAAAKERRIRHEAPETI